MANQTFREYGPIENDAGFGVTDEGDVVPTYKGVNSPIKTPRGDMPHRRDDISTDQSAHDELVIPQDNGEFTPLTDEIREIGRAGVESARQQLHPQ